MSSTFSNDIENGGYTSTELPSSDKKPSLFQNCVVCFGGITVISLALGLIAGVIAYFYFGIKFLVDYKDINGNCNSHIWDYVLTSLICSFVLGGSQAERAKDENKKEQNSCASIIIAMIWIGISIWGIIEYTNEDCQEIKETPLWTFAHVISIIQMIIGCLTFLISCCICVCAQKS